MYDQSCRSMKAHLTEFTNFLDHLDCMLYLRVLCIGCDLNFLICVFFIAIIIMIVYHNVMKLDHSCIYQEDLGYCCECIPN